MLELRPVCENCNKPLPYNSTEAYICTFECTFCRDCALEILENICPNCGGGFTPRPIRPKEHLAKYPPSTKELFHPVAMAKHKERLLRLKEIKPEDR